MRTGKRNWILIFGAICVIVFLVGKFSNTTPESVQAADTRTALERYVSAYSLYTQAELDRFQRYQSAVAQSDWDTFWAMLVRAALCSAVILGSYFGFNTARVWLEGRRNKACLLSTPYGNYWVEQDSDGRRIPRPIENIATQPTGQKQVETLPVFHNGKMESIEVSKEGKVVTVVEDAADFLTRAIKASNARSNELPHHDKMGVSGEKWSAMVHETLGGLFSVENKGKGERTYCAAYPDLGTTYFAVINKEVPLPEKKKAKK